MLFLKKLWGNYLCLTKFKYLLAFNFLFLLQVFNPALSAPLIHQSEQDRLIITADPADHCNYNQRIKSIILHYTVIGEDASRTVLKQGDVSAHYLIPKKAKFNGTDLWQLVPIKYRAWHAGKSYWQTRAHLNDTSIGIEIVNYGYGLVQAPDKILWPYQVERKIRHRLIQEIKNDKSFYHLLLKKNLLSAFLENIMRGLVPPRNDLIYKKYVSKKNMQKYTVIMETLREKQDPFLNIKINDLYDLQQRGKLVWDDYTPHQCKVLVVLLKKLLKELEIKDQNGNICYQIQATDIIGHSDIASDRKSDPGPQFPWKYLAEHGIGAWPDTQDVRNFMAELSKNKKISIAWLQDNLRLYGYNIQTTKILDQQSKDAIRAFQWHFEPDNASGIPSLKTVAILEALFKKYPPKDAQPIIQPRQVNFITEIKNVFNAGLIDIKNQFLILNKDLNTTHEKIDLFF
ncbi:MAG: N-acetylmuramoyl-L-alanine amidase [Candidatus Aquirickettsiella sp.]